MKTFQRSEVRRIADNISSEMPVFQVITGPRQAGKTTAANQIMKRFPYESIYASADAPVPVGPEWIESQWLLAERKAEATSQPVLLVLDEVQKANQWSEAIKSKWDRKKHDIRLLILGSSALLIQKGLTESLAGRFFLNRFTHWSFEECKQAFGWSLEEWIYFGGYPGTAVFKEDVHQWKQYVNDSLIETVLSKDVLQLHPVTKPALLRNLFGLATTFPAQVLSYNKMLGQLQDAGNTTTLAHYLDILGTAYLVSGLELFSKGHVKKRGSSPKLILWNNALINGISLRSYEQTMEDRAFYGRLVENAVGAHLLNRLAGAPASITYWRKGSNEVDFVLNAGEQVVALEVKSGRPDRTSGMDAFRKVYPKSRTLIVGSNGIPLEDFFCSDPQQLFSSVG
ncbi:MAG: ATP-binding protein [Verrucomicrobiota bacterium]